MSSSLDFRTAAALALAVSFITVLAGAVSDKEIRKTIVTPGRTIILSDGSMPAETEEGGLLIVQFRGEPGEADLLRLSLRGIELGESLGNGAYWVRTRSAAELAGVQSVRAAVRAQPGDKIAPLLARRAAAVSPDRRLRISVSLFNGISYDAAAAVIGAHGGRLLHDGLLYGGRLEVEIPASALNRLASSDFLVAVEPLLSRKEIKNDISAARSRVDVARSTFGFDGTGVSVGVWDGGKVDDHQDFDSRLIIAEDVSRLDHATHVAGTIASSGASRPQGMGMAPAATIVSYDYEGGVAGEIAAAFSQYGIAVSNNSWGYVIGWYQNTEEENRWEWYGDYFGWYAGISAAYDDLIYKKNLSIVFSAGNDRNDSGPAEGESWWDFDNYEDGLEVNDPPPPHDGPFHTMGINASAKNVIAVGATDFVDNITSFSSWGPPLDGRIKPEVVAKGNITLSTVLNNQYTWMGGTSMSAPVVSGSLALLIEHWRNLTGKSPTPAVLRAVVTATANDLGRKGPDYSYGFGLLDVYAAAKVMSDDADKNTIVKGVVRKKQSKRAKYYKFSLGSGTKLLKVGLAWIDPPAAALAPKALVNDLDLKVMWVKRGKIRKEYRPWVLDSSKPQSPATTGVNTVDNIELIEVKNPKKTGEWVVEVTATTLGKFIKQKFVLVIVTDKLLNVAVEETSAP